MARNYSEYLACSETLLNKSALVKNPKNSHLKIHSYAFQKFDIFACPFHTNVH